MLASFYQSSTLQDQAPDEDYQSKEEAEWN